MFWKIINLLTRIIYARRIRHVHRVGEAARLAQSDPEQAIAALAKMERRIHASVRSMHALTWGRVLDGMGRREEAESKVIQAAKLDPSNLHAHLALAEMSARRFQLKNAEARLKRLSEENSPEIQDKVEMLLSKLAAIASGEEAKRYERQARKLALKPIGPNGETTGIPADISIVDEWVVRDRGAALDHFEQIVFLFGESLRAVGGRWRISPNPRDSLVILKNGDIVSPFEIVSNRFADSSISLLKSFSAFSK